jgi:ubiquinone/menaquinone biosynthesis C-methylase UbiE
MSQNKVNLACGSVFVTGDDWLNFDYASSCPAVHAADLLSQLPLEKNSASLVYSSHFLEHIPRAQVTAFLSECWRILHPGGVLRLVVPDLENLCRTYLDHRDRGEHAEADFLVLELLDQCVRSESGGELGRYYNQLRLAPKANAEAMAFVRQRTGEDLISPTPKCRLRWAPAKLVTKLERLWIKAVLMLLPKAFRNQNVSLAAVGERHQWLYDAYQLQQLLAAAGFVDIQPCTAATSRVNDFPFQPLDLDADGQPRKGAESMFIEAQKPV